ncbi:MAG: hypothetical protein SOH60_04175 [Lachnospiraceae bacterium]|jgi:hypothetical protein
MAENDFKYVLDDLYSVRLGVKYTYEEVIENPDISTKFRNICRQVFEKEVDGNTTLESHLYYLSPDSESAKYYQHLRTKVTAEVLDPKHRSEDGTPLYREMTLPVKELAGITPQVKKQMGMILHEVCISKMGLATTVI